MNKLFDIEGPVISTLTKLADILILNMLFIICSLPVFTIGTSFTALYYVTLKMVKNEECYTVKSFFKSFRLNFIQSTVIWLIALVILAVFFVDIKVLNGDYSQIVLISGTAKIILAIIIMALVLLYVFTLMYVFPVLSRFDNTVINTIKNAFIMSISHFPQSIVILIITVVPLVLIYYFPRALILIFFVFGLCAYCKSFLFVKIFEKYMPEVIINNDEDFHILNDDETKK